MKLKLYTLGSLLLIVATGVYTYVYFGEDLITHKIYTTELTLPLYLWVIAPMAILFILSFFHLLVYGIRNKMNFSRWEKDSLNLIDVLNAALIGKSKHATIKHESLSEVASVLAKSQIKVVETISDLEKSKLKENLEKNKTIYKGGYVPLGKSDYAKNSPILIRNQQNRLKQDPDFAKQVIKNSGNYDNSIIDDAIVAYMQQIEPKELQNVENLLTADAINALIERANRAEFALSEENLTLLVKKADEKQLIPLASVAKKHLLPDAVLATFKHCYEEDPAKNKMVYVYLLLEYEMIEKAAQELAEEEENGEYQKLQAYIDLKAAGKKYPLDLFI